MPYALLFVHGVLSNLVHLLYSFLLVIPQCLILYADILEHSVCSIFIGGSRPPMKMEQTECSKMLAYKIQTPGNHPEE